MKMSFLAGLLILASLGVLRGESAPSEPIELKVAPGFEAERVLAAGAERRLVVGDGGRSPRAAHHLAAGA